MSVRFGAIALKDTDTGTLKNLCDEWETENWFSDYIILEGKDHWNTIFDENLEWGNVDVFIDLIFNQLKTTILSVEYDADRVRYKLWKNGDCIGEKTIEENAEETVMLIESVLQCQLWKWNGPSDGIKITPAKCCPRECIENYFKRKRAVKPGTPINLDKGFLVKKATKVKGTWMGICSEGPVILGDTDGEAIFYTMNHAGELQEELRVSSKVINSDFWTKHYAGNGHIGFLTKDNVFALYKQNKLLWTFPEIRRSIMPAWYAYMPNDHSIFMEWACYDLRNGKKKWDFPLPVREKSWAKFLQQEMWHELPGGLILTQVNVDQERLYLSLMDQQGDMKKTVAVKMSYRYYHVGIGNKYIYLIRETEQATGMPEVILYDFELNEVGNYRFDAKVYCYSVGFDSNSEYFCVVFDEKIIRVSAENHERQEYPLPCSGEEMTSWSMLPDNILLLVVKERELFFLDTHKNMECVLRHKVKGIYLDCFLLDSGNMVIVSMPGKNKKEVIFQEITARKPV